jgi:hypothetical protein
MMESAMVADSGINKSAWKHVENWQVWTLSTLGQPPECYLSLPAHYDIAE